MARAGWCRECGEWVWVDAEGACQRGHGAECVDAVHESEPVADFGRGEMPERLERFNWGVFFLMPLWGLVYGSSAVLGWWVLSIMATFVIGSLINGAASASAVAGASSAATVVGIAIRLWVGMNANKWLWKRERLRMELIEGARPRYTVLAFQSRQLTWLIAGAVLTVLSVLGLAVLGLSTDPVISDVRAQLMITPVQVTAAAVWTFAEVALAAWLAARMRKDSGAPPVRTGGAG